MTNPGHTTLYTGVTNDLVKRVYQHRSGKADGFTSKYSISKLVWYREMESILSAIEFEKKIKAGSRAKKIKLIQELNPEWAEFLPTTTKIASSPASSSQ